MPPHSLTPGFPASLAWGNVLKRGRHMIAASPNMTAAHDFECYLKGWSDLPRPPFLCLGPGAFHAFELEGGGSMCLNQVCLVNRDGRLVPMDFEFMDHKDLPAVIGMMGFRSDRELLSFLIHGMRWKVEAPRQIRVSHNVFSLKERARGVGEATAKLIAKGLYMAEPVRGESDLITESSPCPIPCTPCYVVGMGGADKRDKDEKRPCGNTSDPPPGEVVRERNAPHGQPDGELVLNFNELTGPNEAYPA